VGEIAGFKGMGSKVLEEFEVATGAGHVSNPIRDYGTMGTILEPGTS